MGIGALIDSSIAALAPGWGVRRARSRAILSTVPGVSRALQAISAAAEQNRLTADWNARTTSADGRILADMIRVNARARMLICDDPIARSISNGFRRHIVGTGITARSSAKNPDTGEIDDSLQAFNRAADRLFARVCRPRVLDIERKRSLIGFQAQAIREWVAVGQHFLALVADPRGQSPVGLVLQSFEPEQLFTQRTEAENGNEIRGGIEVDRFGAPVAYWFSAGHQLDSLRQAVGAEFVRIPAENVFHVADFERPWQTHGAGPLWSVIRKLRHSQLYDEYQLVAAQYEAAHMAFVKRMPGTPPAVGLAATEGDRTTDTAGNELAFIQPGMILRGQDGEDITFKQPTRPGDAYPGFIKVQHDMICAGAGLDRPTVLRDFTGATFSGQRQAMIERDYDTDAMQALLVELFLEPLREQVIERGIMLGLLDAPGFLESDDTREMFLSADWRPQAKPWVDPENQANATAIAVDRGWKTTDQVLNELGAPDYVEQFNAIATERQLSRELRLGLSESERMEMAAEAAAAAAPAKTSTNGNGSSMLRRSGYQ